MKKKTTVHIPPPTFAPALNIVSKHAKGRAPKRRLGHAPGRGAFGNGAARAEKQEFLVRSSQAANGLANERSLRRVYRDWFDSQPPEVQAAARGMKLENYSSAAGAHHGNPQGSGPNGVEIDFHDPADLPAASIRLHPVDQMEPQEGPAVEIALCPAEIRATAAVLSSALEWAFRPFIGREDHHGGPHVTPAELVNIGRRAAALIGLLREDLGMGLEADPGLEANLHAALEADGSTEEDIARAGEVFGRALEWLRRGATYSALGERLYLQAYVLRPVLVGSPTLDEIGAVMNKSRQAMDKLVQCLRDTFGGLKNMAMRGEDTRQKCRAADRDSSLPAAA